MVGDGASSLSSQLARILKTLAPIAQTRPRGTARFVEPLALGLFVFAWLGALALRALISADEGRYASLSLAMLQTGDWITPRLNGLLYFEKPPLQYWAGAVGMALFGVNEFAARLWPGLSGLAIVFLVAFTARRLWGARAGLHALLIAGSMTWIVLNSHFLSLDAGLAAALTLVLCAVLLAEQAGGETSRRRWMLAAWAGMALAVLSKGLVGIVIPGATLVVHSLWCRDLTLWRHLEWLRGPAVLLLITAPWFVSVSARNPDFAWFFFVHEHFQRYLSTVHRREGAWWYFVPILLIGMMPWTSALPWVWRARRTDFAASLLVVWALFVFVFFSASSSKLPSYILPMFPALALLLARLTDRANASAMQRHLWLPALVWAAALIALPFADRLAGKDTPVDAVNALARGLALGAALFLFGAIVGWFLLRRDKITPALAVVAAAHLAATFVVLGSHDRYGRLKSSHDIAPALAPFIASALPVFAVRDYDQTLPFYLRRPVILVDYQDEFAFGEEHEPDRWIPSIDAFTARWQIEAQAAAYMAPSTFETLRRSGLTMRVVFEDPRRVVVVKP